MIYEILSIIMIIAIIVVFLGLGREVYKILRQTEQTFYWCLRNCNKIGILRDRVNQVLNDNKFWVTIKLDNTLLLEGYGEEPTKKSEQFLHKLYIDDNYKFISLYEIYDFAEEFNTSIDFLLGRSDKEYL